jgi:hypothetical protein
LLSNLGHVHPELRALVGAKVPDLRGIFLRGLGGNSNPLGQKQAEAINSDTPYQLSLKVGYIEYVQAFSGCRPSHGEGDNPACSRYSDPVFVPSGGYSQSTTVYFQTGQNETRPQNIAVRYLIKAIK